MERLHKFDDRDVRAGVDELVISIGSVGPTPRVGESVELRLAHLPAWFAKENIVIGVRIKRRIEIDKIDALGVHLAEPIQVISKVEIVHARAGRNAAGLPHAATGGRVTDR